VFRYSELLLLHGGAPRWRHRYHIPRQRQQASKEASMQVHSTQA
jgi:hypothetical protein